MKQLLLILILCLAEACGTATTIWLPAGAAPRETLAGREVRRYIYLRTGQLLPIKIERATTVALYGNE